ILSQRGFVLSPNRCRTPVNSFEQLEARTLMAAQSPYNGAPFAVGATPVTIQAEHFDLGGQDVAYFDNSAGNGGATAFRAGEDVDLKGIAGGGYRINGAYAGEWTEYTADVATAGTYTLESRVSSQGSAGTFHVERRDAATDALGENLTGTLTIPNTGGE
ncbi:MAG: carbohydrate-binding protein, partial [Planctomycetota bacterium]|nr:carbohydrate-binding protein [Planctomycetota bacterium]